MPRFLNEENAEDYAKALNCGFCKTNLTKGQEGIIQSPGYPDSYMANAECLWLLETADLDDRIVIECPTIDLGNSFFDEVDRIVISHREPVTSQ